jgi:PKD repeat protein
MMKKLTLLFLAITCISISAYSTPPCIPSFTTDIAHGDTICVGLPVSFTNTSDVGAESLTFKQWNFGDGSNPINVENPTHIFTQSGTFTVTFQLASSSCTGMSPVQQTITVIDPPGLQTGSQQPSCFGFCDGEAQLFITSGSHTNYVIEWDDPATQNTDVAVNLCDGVYFATVTDIYGCVATGPSVLLTEPDEIIVDAGSDVFICEGSQWPLSEADVVSGGVGSLEFIWEPGAALDDPTLLNPILDVDDPSDFGLYILTAIDDNGCSGSSGLEVIESPGAIHGTIIDPGTGSGMQDVVVSLITRGNDDTQWETYDTFTTLGDGMFHFINLPLANYIVKAEKPGSELLMPTYYHPSDTIFDWEEAHITTVGCGDMFFNTDIELMAAPRRNGWRLHL